MIGEFDAAGNNIRMFSASDDLNPDTNPLTLTLTQTKILAATGKSADLAVYRAGRPQRLPARLHRLDRPRFGRRQLEQSVCPQAYLRNHLR